MYAYKNNCIENCISEKYRISKNLWPEIEKIVTEIGYVAKTGRPGIQVNRALDAIFYILKTGIQWNALPKCFGSYSAAHRAFKKFEQLGFFKILWEKELQIYAQSNSAALAIQAGDCSHIQAPLGREVTGPSPVNRAKLGSKRSIITDKNGVVLGYSLGAGNVHDSQLFLETVLSIPPFIRRFYDWPQMHLDAAYDSQQIQTILFNLRYILKINRNK